MSYQPRGFGLALTIAETHQSTDGGPGDPSPIGGIESIEVIEGVLRISDAGVTLELPMTDGRTPVLAWDPAEVNWEAMVS